MTDPTKRFSSRVDNYVRYRPRYPTAILECLRNDCHLSPASVIADLGSGTGFLAELFLANGNVVFGIEPNREMREAGERLLKSYPNFKSLPGAAEATGLANRSVDFVAAGQAFHWFDRERCRGEFERILQPGGWVALVWNERRTDSSAFLAEYEQLLQTYSTDYSRVDHRRIDAAVLRDFFGVDPVLKRFANHQQGDFEFLRGRLLSSSYVPDAGEAGHAEMLAALERLFGAHRGKDGVLLEYDTLLYYGRLA